MEHFEKTLETQRLHEGRIINLREDTVLLPSGRQSKREIVEHRGAVCVLPVRDDGKLVMVRQFRKPAEAALLEVPAGGLEKDESPEECARRELIEECGFHAQNLEPLFTCFLAPGYSTELMHGFLGTNLEDRETDFDEDENVETEFYTLEELLTMLDEGHIQDAKTICALLAYYRLRV